MLSRQLSRSRKTVEKDALTPLAIALLAAEQLQTRRVVQVGAIGVGFEVRRAVRRVGVVGDLGVQVPHTAKDRRADIADALGDCGHRIGAGWYIGDQAVAASVEHREPDAERVVVVEEQVIRDRGG